MADVKLSALPPCAGGVIAAFDKIICLAAGVASLVTPNGLFQTSFATDSSPSLVDTLVVVSDNAGAARRLTLQQLADTDSLLAADAAPADTDKLRSNQAGVAKTLTLAQIRTQLDAFAATRNIAASQISLSTGTALQLPTQVQLGGASASFPMLKRNAAGADFRLADDSDYAAASFKVGYAIGDIRVVASGADISGPFDTFYFRSVGSAGGNYLSLWKGDIRFTVGSNAENGQDTRISRAAAGVLSIDGATSGDALGQIKCAGTTGAGVAAIGANSPASTLTAPYVWLKFTATDGSQVYVPAWK